MFPPPLSPSLSLPALPLLHHLQDAFEVMAESYEFSQCDGQCLAFRRAASVLKSVPWPVERLGAATRLPCLGEHTRAVMEVGGSPVPPHSRLFQPSLARS